MSQIDIFDEIIVDNFAGGGGASTGIELAAGRPGGGHSRERPGTLRERNWIWHAFHGAVPCAVHPALHEARIHLLRNDHRCDGCGSGE